VSGDIPEFIARKLRSGEDIAVRMQKPEWFTRGNRELLDGIIKEAVNYLRGRAVTAGLQRLDALATAEGALASVRLATSPGTRTQLETVFICLRAARTGRGFPSSLRVRN